MPRAQKTFVSTRCEGSIGELKAVFKEGEVETTWKVGIFSECSRMWHMENIHAYDRVTGELLDIDFNFR